MISLRWRVNCRSILSDLMKRGNTSRIAWLTKEEDGRVVAETIVVAREVQFVPTFFFLPLSTPAGTAGRCSSVLDKLSCALGLRVKSRVAFGVYYSIWARASDLLPLEFGGVDCHFNTLHGAEVDSRKKSSADRDRSRKDGWRADDHGPRNC